MKHDSLLFSSLRAFLKAFAAMCGCILGLIVLILAIVLLSKEECIPSCAKILPDADGHRKELPSSAPTLLTIHLQGEIGEDGITGKKIEEILLRTREKELKGRVKGILLVIDSPGGGVTDSDIIFRLLTQYKARYQTPIYAYVDGLCASGGYYIACAADKIFASNVSMVGSVGVLSWPPFLNASHLLEKIGVNSLTVAAGKGKDAMNPFRPWKEGEQSNYVELIDACYNEFVDHVAKHRPLLTKEKLTEVYGAKVFIAKKAQEIGFVDTLYELRSDVVRDLALASGIAEGKKYQVITFETKNWWKKLVEERSPLFTGKMRHELVLPTEMRSSGMPAKLLYTP